MNGLGSGIAGLKDAVSLTSRRPRFSRRLLPAALLLLLAAVFRFPALDSIPAALFRDELEKGYTAWELGTTGRYGRLISNGDGAVIPSGYCPLFTDVYGVRTSAIYQWLSAPGMAIGGLNAFSTRIVAALAGTLSVLVLFLWARRVWGFETALWSGFWLALMPWHVVFSRWAQQGITEPLWLLLGVWCFEKGRSPTATPRACSLWWMGGGIFAAAAFYAYEVGRVFVPLWALALVLAHSHTLRRKRVLAFPGCIALAVLAVPVAWIALGAEGSARFNRISVFGQTSSTLEAAGLFLRNWVCHFDPRFLFLTGDANPRHQLTGLGLMFLAQAPLVLIGFVALLRRRSRGDGFLLAWALLYPISASLTVEGVPHALRSIVGIPAWAALSGLGTAELLGLIRDMRRPEKVRRVVISLIVLLLIGFPSLALMRSLFHRWPAESALAFEWPAQQVTLALLSSGNGADRGEETREQPDWLPERWLSGYVPYAPHRLLFHGRVVPDLWQKKGLAALPARLLPPLPLTRAWPMVGEGDILGLLAPDLATLPPSAYAVIDVLHQRPGPRQRTDVSGAIVRKSAPQQ